MKIKFLASLLLLSLVLFSFNTTKIETKKTHKSMTRLNDSLLRHVVLFKFKDNTPKEKIKEIEMAFHELQLKIPQIYNYEWGLNNSPENLNKGLTHCFFLTFKSEADRAIYLPHPDHKAFGALLTPYLDDVLVVDYWSK
tara:strand:+ start:31219 stop:31635 length:417 start_codon:yes stop_codon:yes gene_type:complete